MDCLAQRYASACAQIFHSCPPALVPHARLALVTAQVQSIAAAAEGMQGRQLVLWDGEVRTITLIDNNPTYFGCWAGALTWTCPPIVRRALPAAEVPG
jgi:hypothetical protein